MTLSAANVRGYNPRRDGAKLWQVVQIGREVVVWKRDWLEKEHKPNCAEFGFKREALLDVRAQKGGAARWHMPELIPRETPPKSSLSQIPKNSHVEVSRGGCENKYKSRET